MGKSKNFNLFLMDGEVTARIKCTLSNWTGIAYKIPRNYLDKCKDRKDLKQSGVYFLFEENELNSWINLLLILAKPLSTILLVS